MLFTGDDGLAGIWNLQECFREGLNDLVSPCVGKGLRVGRRLFWTALVLEL